MILRKLANLIDLKFLHVNVLITSIFFSRIRDIVEKMKTDVDRLLSVLIIRHKCPIHFAEIELFFIFETKSSLYTSVFIFSTISQILEKKFDVIRT